LETGGRISEQGSFGALRAKGGFVSNVVLHPDLLEQGSAKPVEEDSPKKASPLPKIFQGPTANDVAERTRRVGDFAVYKYYYAAIGWKLFLSIMALATIYMVTGNFPCKFSIF
jgi:ATP-binding cassette subfamily C (CFTR/MRP) protein 1